MSKQLKNNVINEMQEIFMLHRMDMDYCDRDIEMLCNQAREANRLREGLEVIADRMDKCIREGNFVSPKGVLITINKLLEGEK